MPGAGEAWESSRAEERHQETGVVLTKRKETGQMQAPHGRGGRAETAKAPLMSLKPAPCLLPRHQKAP